MMLRAFSACLPMRFNEVTAFTFMGSCSVTEAPAKVLTKIVDTESAAGVSWPCFPLLQGLAGAVSVPPREFPRLARRPLPQAQAGRGLAPPGVWAQPHAFTSAPTVAVLDSVPGRLGHSPSRGGGQSPGLLPFSPLDQECLSFLLAGRAPS